MQSTVGETMGPPAESEYAVEPVGVAQDDSVRGVAADLFLVRTDVDTEPDHARKAALVQNRVVEGQVRAVAAAVAIHDSRLEHEALVEPAVTGEQSQKSAVRLSDGGIDVRKPR